MIMEKSVEFENELADLIFSKVRSGIRRSEQPMKLLPIEIFYEPSSPGCQAVLLTAGALNILLHPTLVDVNPRRCSTYDRLDSMCITPKIKDKMLFIQGSQAICCYLVNKYAPKSCLYPTRPDRRAAIDNILYFDSIVLTPAFIDLYENLLVWHKPMLTVHLMKFKEAIRTLESYLRYNLWLAGYHLTLADLVCLPTICAAQVMDFDFTPYDGVLKWLARSKHILSFGFEYQRGLRHLRMRYEMAQLMAGLHTNELEHTMKCCGVLAEVEEDARKMMDDMVWSSVVQSSDVVSTLVNKMLDRKDRTLEKSPENEVREMIIDLVTRIGKFR